MESILINISAKVIAKAKNIKAIFFDVDGVLTDGSIIYTNSGDEIKAFNVKDGQVVKHLLEAGMVLGAITGRSSALVAYRSQELKLHFCEQGVGNKQSVILSKAQQYGLSLDEIAYIGDDMIDLQPIKSVGLGVAPSDALPYVCSEAHFVTKASGGRGVLREVADIILAAQGKLGDIVNKA